MKPIRAIAVLPTMFTLGNLVCGFFAIVVASRIVKPQAIDFVPAPKIDWRSARELIGSDDPTHNLMLGAMLILAAMVFDTFDGQVARLTKRTSDFGAQLDSLCDLVSFGVAPAFLLVKMCPQFTYLHSEAIWSVAALFACCAALRLARFNIEMDNDDPHTSFTGLPTPAAAAVIASFAILSYTLRNEIHHEYYTAFDSWMQRLLPFFVVLIALLMVSRIPYPHVVTQLLRGQRSFAHVVGLVFASVALLTVRAYAVPLICVLFVFGPAVRYFWHLARNRRTAEEEPFI